MYDSHAQYPRGLIYRLLLDLQVKTEDIDPGLIENESEVRSAVSGTTSTWTQPPQHMSHNHNLSHNHNHTLSHDDSGHSSGGEGGGGGGGRSGSGASGSGSQPVVHDGKHSLLQFALQHFRMSKEQGIVQSDGTLQASNNKNKKKKTSKDQVAEWTWKEQVRRWPGWGGGEGEREMGRWID